MEQVALAVQSRDQFGSKTARRIRRQGLIPAVVYGHGMEPVSLQVNVKDMLSVLHTKAGENVVVNLTAEGFKLKESTCLVKHIQHDPITDEIQHVDFTVISLTEKITVNVPLVVINAEESVGLKEEGVLDVVHHEIEVECLPTAIPEKFEVDVKDMKINDVIHAKDLKIPEGVECKLDLEEAVVAVHPPRKEEELQPSEEEGMVEPEVIEKGKKVEAPEGEEAAAPAPANKEKAEKKPG